MKGVSSRVVLPPRLPTNTLKNAELRLSNTLTFKADEMKSNKEIARRYPNLSAKSNKELINKLKEANLPVSGNKTQLITRYVAFKQLSSTVKDPQTCYGLIPGLYTSGGEAGLPADGNEDFNDLPMLSPLPESDDEADCDLDEDSYCNDDIPAPSTALTSDGSMKEDDDAEVSEPGSEPVVAASLVDLTMIDTSLEHVSRRHSLKPSPVISLVTDSEPESTEMPTIFASESEDIDVRPPYKADCVLSSSLKKHHQLLPYKGKNKFRATSPVTPEPWTSTADGCTPNKVFRTPSTSTTINCTSSLSSTGTIGSEDGNDYEELILGVVIALEGKGTRTQVAQILCGSKDATLTKMLRGKSESVRDDVGRYYGRLRSKITLTKMRDILDRVVHSGTCVQEWSCMNRNGYYNLRLKPV